MIYYNILYYTLLYYTLLYYAILYCTILCYTMNYHTIQYYTMIYHTILHYTILCYAMLRYAILHYTILCCTILWTLVDLMPVKRLIRTRATPLVSLRDGGNYPLLSGSLPSFPLPPSSTSKRGGNVLLIDICFSPRRNKPHKRGVAGAFSDCASAK